MFKKKLREFYEESWGFSLEEERSGYESSFQYCTMTWGDISLFTGYTLRKMAVDFCMESFLNISENIVRARGRWFQSIAALVSEIKQYKDSFRKYNLITSSAQVEYLSSSTQYFYGYISIHASAVFCARFFLF
mmetsp:Transcript_18667/g.22780  ORF Transcript_18667/g.22780 Transcript_18667/m.22780 type:complete len:133 (-) Transcript_18667:2907-3305(-)